MTPIRMGEWVTVRDSGNVTDWQWGKIEYAKRFRRKRAAHFVIIAADNMHIGCYGPEIVVGFAVANIASAKDLLNFSWHKELLEL